MDPRDSYVLWCVHSDQGLFELFQNFFGVPRYIEYMRTTHPEIQRVDNIKIGAGPSECSHHYHRPQYTATPSEEENVQEAGPAIHDSVSLSAESFQDEANSGLCANLLAAWG